MSKRALGRGLGALIPGADEQAPPADISIELISPNPYQPRTAFDPGALQELAQSIAEHGLLQPVVVRPAGEGYQLVVGERRLRAAKLAGKASIPAVIMELDERQLAEIALVENLQREDLNPLEEAQAFSRLVTEFNLTQEVLAQRIGKSRSAVANTLRLLNLAPPVQALVAAGTLSPGHARTLLSLAEPEQLAAAEKIISQGLTVRAAEKKQRFRPKTSAKSRDPNLIEIQERLMERLGTKVVLEEKDGKGRIVIEYYSVQDGDRIVRAILQ